MVAGTRARVLMLCDRSPWPTNDGGKIRILHTALLLSEVARVQMLCLAEAAPESTPPCPPGLELAIVPQAPGARRLLSATNIYKAAATRLPLSVARFHEREFGARLKAAVATGLDAVWVEKVHLWQYLCGTASDIPRVLNLHNIESDIYRRYAQTRPWTPAGRLADLAARQISSYERQAWREADVCLCVSEHDRQAVARTVPEAEVQVLPNCIDTDSYEPDWSHSESDLLYVGNLAWAPNVDAVVYFAHEILPLIRERLPDCGLVVVGQSPAAPLRRLADEGRIRLIGSVADVRPYRRAAAVEVVPLRVGGGTRLKIAEAMAMGKAVVTTSVGCEGLQGLRDGANIMIADEPQQFAASVCALLAEADLRHGLGRAARAAAEAHYDYRLFRPLVAAVIGKVTN